MFYYADEKRQRNLALAAALGGDGTEDSVNHRQTIFLTMVRSFNFAVVMINRSKGSSWIGGNFAAAILISKSSERIVGP
jgi:hypothetical protein